MASFLDLPKFALAIDWETSGYRAPQKRSESYAQEHQGISFGALVIDMRSFEIVEELYREIQFNPRYKWDFGAEKVHGISQAKLASGVSQEQAAIDLANLIVKYFGATEVIMVGHRVYFDRDFTDQLFDVIDIKVPWHPTLIDVSAVATATIEMANSEQIFQALGMPPRGAHNALEDIKQSVEVLRTIKEYTTLGLMVTLDSQS
jgi:oligoribonuclease (3'-5' exoribonuclease)